MIILQLLLYFFAFAAIWYGADLIVKSTVHFSRRLRLSSFSVSFFILGMLTSLPEFALGLTSIASQKPAIFVGNLIGGIMVIFLFIIPLLAFLGRSIRINHDLDRFSLIFALIVTAAPSALILDHRVTASEGLVLILLYLALFYVIESKHGFLSESNQELSNTRSYSLSDLLRILFGILIVFVSGNFIVSETILFSSLLHISPFIISLIFLSLGTNLPEISLAVKTVLGGHRDIAFGDYIGSAAANTFLFGFFTLMNQADVVVPDHFFLNLFFMILGMVLFYFFSRSQNNITRKEGAVLLLVYLVYIVFWLVAR